MAKKINLRDFFPSWIYCWMVFNTFILFYDPAFVLLRPYSQPGPNGAWFNGFFYPHWIYQQVDRTYRIPYLDGFTIAESILNVFEASLCLLSLVLYHRSSIYSVLLSIVSGVMTVWKTILFLLTFTELCRGTDVTPYVECDTWPCYLFIFLIPALIWVFVPGLVVGFQCRTLANVVERHASFGGKDSKRK